MNYNPTHINSMMNFGKFKGQSIIDIWKGQYEQESDAIIRNYLLERFSLESGDKIPASDADYSDCSTELGVLNEQKISAQIEIVKNYIIFTGETSQDNIIMIKKVVKAILQGSYREMTKTVAYRTGDNLDDLSFSENSLKFLALSGEPRYLKWCIENVDSFFIFPDDLEILTTTDVKVFETFSATDLAYDVLKYQPVFRTYKSQISPKTEQVNLQKYKRYKSKHADRNGDSFYASSDAGTNWEHYNDDLDMDQQSPDFWNQF